MKFRIEVIESDGAVHLGEQLYTLDEVVAKADDMTNLRVQGKLVWAELDGTPLTIRARPVLT